MMAKNSEFEEEMRKSDTAAYRAGLADEQAQSLRLLL
jgi:hypothetical protein